MVDRDVFGAGRAYEVGECDADAIRRLFIGEIGGKIRRRGFLINEEWREMRISFLILFDY